MAFAQDIALRSSGPENKLLILYSVYGSELLIYHEDADFIKGQGRDFRAREINKYRIRKVTKAFPAAAGHKGGSYRIYAPDGTQKVVGEYYCNGDHYRIKHEEDTWKNSVYREACLAGLGLPVYASAVNTEISKPKTNWYSYTSGDPVNRWDPSGLDDVEYRDGTLYWLPDSGDTTPIPIGGQRGGNGWIGLSSIVGGGRFLEDALPTLRAIAKDVHVGDSSWMHLYGQSTGQMNVISAHIKSSGIMSPFSVNPSSNSFGIFIDGTGSHVQQASNVSYLYDDFQGSKFYFGGVGNRTEYTGAIAGGIGGGGFGLEFQSINDRALADISKHWTPGQSLYIYGFSRGAAGSNELAKLIKRTGIRKDGKVYHPKIERMGLFDPVYSVGRPGQSSNFVMSTEQSEAGNYVTAKVSSIVKNLDVLYSQHEERTYFPATRFNVSSSTVLNTATSPGRHSDVGGHIDNNQFIMKLTRNWMIASAGSGSPFTQAERLSSGEFNRMTSWSNYNSYKPGPYGVQASQGVNWALPIGAWDQQLLNHYPRDLWWVGPSILPNGELLEFLYGFRGDVLARDLGR